MEAFLLAIRLILAVVFGVAGVAKFADPSGSRKALNDFGLPGSLVPLFSVLLPASEIAVALAFLFVGTSWFGAIGALLLLAVFSVGMSVQIRLGNAPDCHCFGQIHSEPVGVKSLVRNILIMAPAGFLLFEGRGNQGLSIANIAPEIIQMYSIVLVVAILGAMAFYLRRISEQQNQIIRRLEIVEVMSRDGASVERDAAGDPHDGLPIGALLPELDVRDLEGNMFNTGRLRSLARPSLLIFVSPTCGPCQALLPKLNEWVGELAGKVDFVLVSSGTSDENVEKFGLVAQNVILLQNEREFADLVSARWTPSALLLSSDGRIASHVAAGDSAIEVLIGKIKSKDMTQEFDYFDLGNRGPNQSISRVTIGERIPDFAVTAIDGQSIKAADLQGKQTLVTFWSPSCPHCLNMIDQIKNWDIAKSEDDPDLLVFSDGEENRHREIGLRSPIVLDKSYKVAQKLGMHGTPSAILISSDGKFASELAIGAPNIWALIGRRVPNNN